jgi:hypothetical protein
MGIFKRWLLQRCKTDDNSPEVVEAINRTPLPDMVEWGCVDLAAKCAKLRVMALFVCKVYSRTPPHFHLHQLWSGSSNCMEIKQACFWAIRLHSATFKLDPLALRWIVFDTLMGIKWSWSILDAIMTSMPYEPYELDGVLPSNARYLAVRFPKLYEETVRWQELHYKRATVLRATELRWNARVAWIALCVQCE